MPRRRVEVADLASSDQECVSARIGGVRGWRLTPAKRRRVPGFRDL